MIVVVLGMMAYLAKRRRTKVVKVEPPSTVDLSNNVP